MWNPLEAWKRPKRLWRELCFVVLGAFTGPIGFSVTVTLLATSIGLLITLPLALPVIWLLFALAHLGSSLERSRIVSLLDIELHDPVRPVEGKGWKGWLRRMRLRAGDVARWKEIVYHLLSLPMNIAGFVEISVVAVSLTTLILLPLYVDALPGGSAKFWLFGISDAPGSLLAAGLGMVLLLLAPTVTTVVTWTQSSLARVLIGRGRDAELTEKVTRLERSRSAAVDSAETERRRIERDLHDGAQQRLVALAASLGSAREKFDTDDVTGGRELVSHAHEEAKSALKEIRDLVRGIHPVILEDRGLDAALSAVVARSPIPVTLRVESMARPSGPAESTAYFVVNEALTNVARHSQATRAHVTIARTGDRLIVEIRDDGVGGADASLGTGLQGLRDRVTGQGGTMHVISPEGGPTTVSVEVPCGS